MFYFSLSLSLTQSQIVGVAPRRDAWMYGGYILPIVVRWCDGVMVSRRDGRGVLHVRLMCHGWTNSTVCTVQQHNQQDRTGLVGRVSLAVVCIIAGRGEGQCIGFGERDLSGVARTDVR